MEESSDAGLALVSACRRLYSAIDRLDQAAAVKVGVNRSDLRALNELEHGPVRAGHLAEALGLTTGSISSLLDRLENLGLVTRGPDPSDRRAVLVSPTRKLFSELAPLYRGVAEQLIELAKGYGPRQQKSALKTLEDVVLVYERALDS
ncbi:MAG: MarR family transcriptional regulator [Myxococcota bacterium]